MEYGFDFAYVFKYVPKLLSTLDLTLLIVAGAIATGLIIGLLVALPRLYHVPVLKQLSMVYVSFFRGTPVLIQLFLFYYGLPEILKLVYIDVTRVPVLYFVIFTLGLNAGAFISETIRAAVTAVNRGQVEAAYAVGMTGYQAFTRIILPQALAIAVPVFSNLVIAMLKETSLAFTLGVMEMTGKAQSLGALSQHFLETYISLAIIYLIISLLLERVLLLAERRLQRHMRREQEKRSWFGLRRVPPLNRLTRELNLEKKEVPSYEA
ncbi:L-cystine transport system permease protein [Paenibacillus cellulosilyticus]|uniref:L-cystine transport system permease protein n=1 Tax=Paenibacillus cellulosilyticus TaxID=375489 RepID=A0A2V2YQZ2_9BACL|nr:amino acid ABC transporter permease [Paenibacillus cellulosilyticus]PWV97308.1 L-cystine transport system permease protein [Paenibacillus cellulosilyticus]QKS47491.1 amino acid ABC transporter permease [Paenibacillus cellulosilyticus]